MTSQLPYYYIGKDGKRVLARDLEDDRDRLREALREIAERHIPDQPASYGGDERDWAVRQHSHLRAIAIEALEASHDRG